MVKALFDLNDIHDSSNQSHCCKALESMLSDPRSMIVYNRKFNEYGAVFKRSTAYMTMDFCCFCGKQFPLSLRDTWFEVLEKDYGIEASISMTKQEKKQVPAEFFTDEWWKKRRL